MENTILTNEKQVNLKNFRETLGIPDGHTAVFAFKNDEESNKSLRSFQEAMKGAAEEAGWTSDDDVVNFIMELRRKDYENIY